MKEMMMKELMQERPSQPPHPQQQQQHSTESIGKINPTIGAGSSLVTTHGSMPGSTGWSGLGAILDDPPLSSNTSSGPPNQNVCIMQLCFSIEFLVHFR